MGRRIRIRTWATSTPRVAYATLIAVRTFFAKAAGVTAVVANAGSTL